MNYYQAKKLHNEDEVIVKETGENLQVIKTRICPKKVLVMLENGEVYHHTQIK